MLPVSTLYHPPSSVINEASSTAQTGGTLFLVCCSRWRNARVIFLLTTHTIVGYRKTCVIYNRMKALGMYPSRKANLNSGSPNAILSGSTYASNMPAYPNSSPTITGASSTPNGGPPPLAVNPPDFVNLFGGLDFTTFPVSLSASVPNEVVMPDANQAQLPSNTLSFCELNPTGSWATVNSAACAVANQHIQKEEDA